MDLCKRCYSAEILENMTEEQIDAYRDRFLGRIKPSDENFRVSEDAVVEAFEELIEEIHKADNSRLRGVSVTSDCCNSEVQIVFLCNKCADWCKVN